VNFLGPSEFGLLALATAVSAVTSILSTLGIKAAAFQFMFRFERQEEARAFYGTLWLFSIVVPGFLLLLLDRALVMVPPAALPIAEYVPSIRLALWAEYLNSGFRLVVLEVLRAKERPFVYSLLSLGNAATLLALVLAAVMVGRSGVTGVLVAMVLTGLLWAPIYSLFMARHMRLALTLSPLRQALGYSLPLLPHFLSHWLLSLSDRLVLERLVPLGSVGVYSLGYRLGNLAEMFVTAGNSAIMPSFARGSRARGASGDLARLFSQYTYVMGGILLVVGVFANEVIQLATPAAYHPAAAVTRWVVLAFFSLALYYGPMNAMTLTAQETRGVAWNTLLAGLLNVVLNILLVPRFGVLAAAVNTFLGYSVLFFLMLRLSRRVCPIEFHFGKILAIEAALILGLLVDALVPADWLLLGVGIDVLYVGLYLSIGWRLGQWSWGEVQRIWRGSSHPETGSFGS
jgi:O-antigen/teichoic acid export membrane protein